MANTKTKLETKPASKAKITKNMNDLQGSKRVVNLYNKLSRLADVLEKNEKLFKIARSPRFCLSMTVYFLTLSLSMRKCL